MQYETNFVTRVGKILSRQRTPDRYTLVSIFKPKEKAEKDHGVLYFVIEILSPDPAMKKVAQLIEETIISEYYKDLTDGLDSLESAIKKVNEALSDLADEGEVSWIGKINGAIAVLEQNILHITQTGTVEAYLVRENKINHVTENLSSAAEKPNPLKTFLNIASGELSMEDRVIISTSELFYHFSLDDLRRITSKFSPATSAAYIVKMLRHEEVESINTLVLELTTEEEVLSEERKEENEEIIEEPNIIKNYATKLLPFWKLFLSASSKSIEKSKELYKEKVSPTVSKFGEEASKKVSEKVKEIKEKDKEESSEQREGKREPQQDLFETPKKTIFTPALKNAKDSYSKTQEFIGKSKKRSQFFAIAAVLLIVVVFISCFYSYQKKKVALQKGEIEKTYEAIKIKTDGAIKAQRLGDDKKARELLSEAQEEIKIITASAYLHNEISELVEEIDIAIEGIFNIQRFDDLSPMVDFQELDESIKLDNIYKIEEKIISFDRERHQAVSYSLDSQNIESNNAISYDGKIIDLAPFNDKNAIALLSADPYSIYNYNVVLNFIEKGNIVTGDDWPISEAVNTYFNNIYLLVSADNQIYKYSPLANGYTAKTNYINDTSSIDLFDAVDIAIDGSIYVLKNNGEIIQFLSGDLVDFEISGMPAQEFDSSNNSEGNLLSPTKIITNPDINNIYVLDPGARRIVVFDKLGDYITQYISNKFTDLNDFWIEGNIIYVLSGSEIYKIDM